MFKLGILAGAAIAWAIYPGMKVTIAKFKEWKNKNIASAKDDLNKVKAEADKVVTAVKTATKK